MAKVAPTLNRNPLAGPSFFFAHTPRGGLNAATPPGVEDTRNSQRTPSASPSASLYFFLPLFFSPPPPSSSSSSLLLHFFASYNHTYNQWRQGETERGGGGRWIGGGETISSRSSRRLVSTVANSCHGQPSATTGELLSAGGGRGEDGGWGHPLSFSLLFLFLCGGNRDEWASWGEGGFRPAESCAPCLCRELRASGKNSIPRLKGMTRSSGPYIQSPARQFSLPATRAPARATNSSPPPSPSSSTQKYSRGAPFGFLSNGGMIEMEGRASESIDRLIQFNNDPANVSKHSSQTL